MVNLALDSLLVVSHAAALLTNRFALVVVDYL
jgi:hypothetical protein